MNGKIWSVGVGLIREDHPAAAEAGHSTLYMDSEMSKHNVDDNENWCRECATATVVHGTRPASRAATSHINRRTDRQRDTERSIGPRVRGGCVWCGSETLAHTACFTTVCCTTQLYNQVCRTAVVWLTRQGGATDIWHSVHSRRPTHGSSCYNGVCLSVCLSVRPPTSMSFCSPVNTADDLWSCCQRDTQSLAYFNWTVISFTSRIRQTTTSF